MWKRVVSIVLLITLLIPLFVSGFGMVIFANPTEDEDEDEDANTHNSATGLLTEMFKDKSSGNIIERSIAWLIAVVVDICQFIMQGVTPYETLDGLVFNADSGLDGDLQGNNKYTKLPLSLSQWDIIKKLYKAIATIVVAILIIPVTGVALKFIRAGVNSRLREEATQDLTRLFVSALIILLTPVIFPALLFLNNQLVDLMSKATFGGNTLHDTISSTGNIVNMMDTNSALGAAMILAGFCFIEVKLTMLFIVRSFVIMVYFIFTPIMAFMWSMDKSINAAGIWVGEILSNIFMQFFYAFLLVIFLGVISTTGVDGENLHWLVTLTWVSMVLKLGEVLRNSVQGALARMSGLDENAAALGGVSMLASAVSAPAALAKGFGEFKKAKTPTESGPPKGSAGLADSGPDSDLGNFNVNGTGGVGSGASGASGANGPREKGGVIGASSEGASTGGSAKVWGGSSGGQMGSGMSDSSSGGSISDSGLDGGLSYNSFDAGSFDSYSGGAIPGSSLDGGFPYESFDAEPLDNYSGGAIPGSSYAASTSPDSDVEASYAPMEYSHANSSGDQDTDEEYHSIYNLRADIAKNHNTTSGIGKAASVAAGVAAIPLAILGGEAGRRYKESISGLSGRAARGAVGLVKNEASVKRHAKETGKTIAQVRRELTGVHMAEDAGRGKRAFSNLQAVGRLGSLSVSSSEKALRTMSDYKIIDRFGMAPTRVMPTLDNMRYKQ